MKISARGDNKIQIVFSNGVSVSTIWGYCTHSEHNDGRGYKPKIGDEEFIEIFRFKYESNDVEVMVSCSDNKWLKKLHKKYKQYSDGDSLFDYLPVDVWADLLVDCKKYKPK